MAIQKDGYYYNSQISKYVLQFMAIFQGLQVMVGKTDQRDEALISVPIHYGAPDRVVASILAGNTQNKPLRLPVMAACMTGLSLDTSNFHGVGLERRSAYVPMGGLVPDDIQVIHQRMPLQCKLEIELHMYASNTDQHLQMIEQVLPLFNPQLMIQTSDGIFDWTRLTSVELTGSTLNPYNEIGQNMRAIQSTHTFAMPIWIDTPADVRKDFIERIYLRIGAVSTAATDNIEIIAELDAQDIPYDLVKDDTDLKID